MKLPDGPNAPRFIQLLQWIANPLNYLETAAECYGEIFTTRWGNLSPYVLLSNPQAIQKLLTADPKQFDSGSGNYILQPILGNYSIVLLDGERHQRQRQLLTPPFHGERMKAYGKLMCDLTEKLIGQQGHGKPFPVRFVMQEISLQVILNAVFGIHEGKRYQQLKDLFTSLLDAVSSPISSSLLFFKSLQVDLGPWSPWGHFVRRQQQIDQLLYAEIEERRANPDPSRTDILSLLMSARDAEGQPMTDEELRDELMTLLFAGHETTASSLAWALYWIHRIPEVRSQLLRELDSLDGKLDPSAIAKLSYLTAVCSETLRIYPVAMIILEKFLLLLRTEHLLRTSDFRLRAYAVPL